MNRTFGEDFFLNMFASYLLSVKETLACFCSYFDIVVVRKGIIDQAGLHYYMFADQEIFSGFGLISEWQWPSKIFSIVCLSMFAMFTIVYFYEF